MLVFASVQTKALLRISTNLGCAPLKVDLLRKLQNSGTCGFVLGLAVLEIMKDFSAFICRPSCPRPSKLGRQTLRKFSNYVLSDTTSHSTKLESSPPSLW